MGSRPGSGIFPPRSAPRGLHLPEDSTRGRSGLTCAQWLPGTSGGFETLEALVMGCSPVKRGDPAASPEVQWSNQPCEVPSTVPPKTRGPAVISSHSLERDMSARVRSCGLLRNVEEGGAVFLGGEDLKEG